MKKRLNLTTQALIIISIVLLVANFSMGLLMIYQSGNGMKTLIQQRMRDIANTAAANIDGDVLESLTAEDEGTEGYQSIMDELTIYQDNIELEYIYCIAQAEDGSFVFSVDPTVDDPGEFGEPIVYTEALDRAFSGETAVDNTPYEDKWGKFYSAYAPAFDSKGEVAGVVAVDFDANWYDTQISNIVSIILLCSLMSLIIGALIVALFTARIRRRFRLLNSELEGLSSEVDKLTGEITKPAEVDNISSKQKDNEKNEDPEERIPADNIGHLEDQIRDIHKELEGYLNHLHTQERSMITALASEYRSVFYVNLDTDKSICYRAPANNNKDNLHEGDTIVFSEFFSDYAQKYVLEDYREDFLNTISADSIRERLAQETTITFRYLSTRSDQEAFEMLHIAGVRRPEDRDDNMIHAVGIGFTDVDKETREALERNRALSEALSEAEESNKAKTAFLSSMSHEIRTPMNAIIGLDNIMLNDPDISESTRVNLEKISISANHLLNIINDILDMSRIESGHMALKKEEFILSSVLEQVNMIISEQCNNKGITYQCVASDTDRYYIGDDGKLRQILINILGNSVKFTPEGGEVTLTVECVARYEGNTTLRFLLTDNGIGMDKDFIPHIFDAFSQEDSSNTNRHSSTGLGMAITKRLVEMMNGNIKVESEKAVGTTFCVTLTLHDSDRAAAEIDSSEMNHQDLRVLVIEADKTECESTRLILEDIGIISDYALSVKRALRLVRLRSARRDPYNLLLIDPKLVKGDSADAFGELREAIGDDVIGMILLGDDRDELLKEEEKLNADGVITKPLSSISFLEEVKEIIERKHGSSEKEVHKAELKGRKILLAEDTQINAEIMMAILDMREMTVDLAENGKIAVDLFSSHPAGYYSAILMDLRMPEMDGLTATSVIRALDRPDAKQIPIIALTANAFDEDVQRSLQVGLNAHLTKPVDPDKLFATLESLITDG